MYDIFNSSVRATVTYRATHQDKHLMLEFVNHANAHSVAKFFAPDDASAIYVQLALLCPYDKVSFGNFVDMFEREEHRVGSFPNADKLFF